MFFKVFAMLIIFKMVSTHPDSSVNVNVNVNVNGVKDKSSVDSQRCMDISGVCLPYKETCPKDLPHKLLGPPYCPRKYQCCYPRIMSADEFISRFNKTYENEEEKNKRIAIFLENSRKIADHNKLYESGKSSYMMGINAYSDMTYDEVVRYLTGGASEPHLFRRSLTKSIVPYIPKDEGKEPSYLDYREWGALNPIRSQNWCGSCWTFATIASIESNIFLKTGILEQLSEQELVDCDSSSYGCNGGWSYKAMGYVIRKGISYRDEYSYKNYPKSEKDAPMKYDCIKSSSKTPFKVSSIQHISPHNDADLLNALVNVGPIAVSIYMSEDFQHYSNGTFEDDSCSNAVGTNHLVVLIGYGTQNGEDYWLIRNSWGTTWGEEGYMKLSRNKRDHCFISSWAYFPVIEGPTTSPEGPTTSPEGPTTSPEGPTTSPEDICASAGGEPVNGKCLTFNSPSLSWSDAKDACAANGGRLASFDDTKAVYDYIATNHPGIYYWTGGSDSANEGTFTWLDGRTFVPNPWYPNRPWSNPADGNPYDCVEVVGGASGGYGDYACNAPRYYICEIAADCSAPWFRIGSECFYLHGPKEGYNSLDWESARSFCLNLGGDLAQPKSIQALADHLFPLHHTFYWLGAGTTQQWLDGTSITGWRQGQPENDNDCVAIHPVYGANSLFTKPCETTQYMKLVCEKHIW